jgi:cytochrome c-type biogenesis protein CcmI
VVLAIVLLVVLTIGALAFIAAPLVRVRSIHRSDEDRRSAQMERDVSLQLLRDLNHDRATGKVDAEDFEEQKAEIEARAIAAMASLDALGIGEGSDPMERLIRVERVRLTKERSR